MALILVGGAVRTGKSSFALRRARRAGTRLVYVATATAGDDEMRARIARHRAERGDAFATVEEPLDVPAALARAAAEADAVVLDCITLWLSNLLAADLPDADILARVDAVAAGPAAIIAVTNEVGMGIVPATPLGRRFRDLAGAAHQRLAARADEIYLATVGTILQIRPIVGEVRW
jgi:adenosylcobinamide kinase/adenosylcobinamide-phosphate guanylyltransferase